jgi:S-adenosylmethionine synthetase
MTTEYLWSTEAVAAGHPDKVADQISDAVLDAYLSHDPRAHVACETMVCHDRVVVAGEVSAAPQVRVDVEAVVRATLRSIGYDRPAHGYDANTVRIENLLHTQSPEIQQAVVQADGAIGAGDQGIMFGYACDESPTYMPLCHHLAFDLVRLIEQDIAAKRCGAAWDSLFLPDAKTQVTMRYAATGMPVAVETLVVSVCHKPVPIEELRAYVHEHVIAPLQARYPQWFDAHTSYLINPADVWLQGGPQTDTGLTGRKIVVDNYGGDCPVGGGAFSGKDPTKVDRSGAYAARHIAKNLVAAGLCRRARVQLAYAIGKSEPVSVRVESDTSRDFEPLIRATLDLTPRDIIERLDLRRPIYRATAAGGHFGRDGFSWERLDLVERFRQ